MYKIKPHYFKFFFLIYTASIFANGELFKIFNLPDDDQEHSRVQYMKYLMGRMPTYGGHNHVHDPLKTIAEAQRLTRFLESQSNFVNDWKAHKFLKIKTTEIGVEFRESYTLDKKLMGPIAYEQTAEQLKELGTLNRKGLSSALILQLDTSLRKAAFTAWPTDLIKLLENNLKEPLGESFEPEKLGLSPSITTNELINLLKDLTNKELLLKESFSIWLSDKSNTELSLDEIVDELDSFLMYLKIDPLPAPFQESFLEFFLRRLNSVKSRDYTKKASLILVEQDPAVTAHRGRVGEDCSSRTTMASTFDPHARVFWVYKGEENPDNLIGYVQWHLGFLNGVAAIYIATISGGGMGQKTTEEILFSIHKIAKNLGVEKIALPNPAAGKDRVNENINNEAVRSTLYKYTRSKPLLSWKYQNPDYRNLLTKFESPLNTRANDSVEHNSFAVEYIPSKNILYNVEIEEMNQRSFELPKTSKADIIRFAVDLRNHKNAIESLRLIMPKYGINPEDWDQFVKLVRDQRFPNLEAFYSAVYSYMAHKWQVDDETILPRDHVFLLHGRTRTPGAFDGDEAKLTIDLVLNDIKNSASQDLRNTNADFRHTRRFMSLIKQSLRYTNLLKKAYSYIKSDDIQLIRNGVSLMVFLNITDPKYVDWLLEIYGKAPRPVNGIIAWYLDVMQPRHNVAIKKSLHYIQSKDWNETLWGFRYFRNVRVVDAQIKDALIAGLDHPHPEAKRHALWALVPYKALTKEQENLYWTKIAAMGKEIEEKGSVGNVKIEDRYKSDFCRHISELINNTWNNDGSETLKYVLEHKDTWWLKNSLKMSNDEHQRHHGIDHPFVSLLTSRTCEPSLLNEIDDSQKSAANFLQSQ